MFQFIIGAKKFKIECIKVGKRNSFTLSVSFFRQDDTDETSQPLISLMGESENIWMTAQISQMYRMLPERPTSFSSHPKYWRTETSWEIGIYGSWRVSEGQDLLTVSWTPSVNLPMSARGASPTVAPTDPCTPGTRHTSLTLTHIPWSALYVCFWWHWGQTFACG